MYYCHVVLCLLCMFTYVMSNILSCHMFLRFQCRYDFRMKRCSVRLYLQLCVGGHMSYLRYLCLLACSGVRQIYYCVFLLFFFVLCILCCQFLWMIHFWLPLRYSLTFIYLPVSLAFPFLVAILVSNIHYQRDLFSVNLFFDNEYIS